MFKLLRFLLPFSVFSIIFPGCSNRSYYHLTYQAGLVNKDYLSLVICTNKEKNIRIVKPLRVDSRISFLELDSYFKRFANRQNLLLPQPDEPTIVINNFRKDSTAYIRTNDPLYGKMANLFELVDSSENNQ